MKIGVTKKYELTYGQDGHGPVAIPCDKDHLGIKGSIPHLLQSKEHPLHGVNGLMGRSVVARN